MTTTEDTSMTRNQSLATAVYELGSELVRKHDTLGHALQRLFAPLSQYEGDLAEASKKELLRIPGVTTRNLLYVAKVLAGEDIEAIAKTIPQVHIYRK